MSRYGTPEGHDARLWIGDARDHLKIANRFEPGLNLRLLCAEAHMGAEKAIKAVMIARGARFPYTHDIGALLDQAERTGEAISDAVRKGEALTLYSGDWKYPNGDVETEPTTRTEYDEALSDAAAIVDWAASRVSALLADKGEPADSRR